MPAGAAYKSSGEIDPKLQQSPPKEIVSKIRNTIESPKREPKSRSPPKPRCRLTYDLSSSEIDLHDLDYI